MSQVTSDPSQSGAAQDVTDVLTVSEAAAFLRVAESDIIELASQHGLPGRQIGDHWRFHKQGLVKWLCVPEEPDFWRMQFGALRGDARMDEMLDRVYEERGRPMTERD